MDITVGTIVSYITYPEIYNSNFNNFLFLTQAEVNPPLMIVIETFREGKIAYDPNTGHKISDESSLLCKCIWFSLKTYTIEEATLMSRSLRPLSNEMEPRIINQELRKVGRLVTLKSSHSIFRRVTIKSEDMTEIDLSRNIKISHTDSIPYPPMEVIGTAKYETKNIIVDPKTGQKRRETPSLLVKCRYYNSVSQKFSEVHLPIEAIVLVPKISQNILALIELAIRRSAYIKLVSKSDSYSTILKPIIVTYEGGYNYIHALDLVNNIIVKIALEEESHMTVTEIQVKSLPSFEENGTQLSVKVMSSLTVQELLNSYVDTGHYLRIVYKNESGVITERTLTDCKLLEESSLEKSDTPPPIHLKAFCHLRRDIRYFRLDRIKRVTLFQA